MLTPELQTEYTAPHIDTCIQCYRRVYRYGSPLVVKRPYAKPWKDR